MDDDNVENHHQSTAHLLHARHLSQKRQRFRTLEALIGRSVQEEDISEQLWDQLGHHRYKQRFRVFETGTKENPNQLLLRATITYAALQKVPSSRRHESTDLPMAPCFVVV